MVTPKKEDWIFATVPMINGKNNYLSYSMEPEPTEDLHPARFSAVLGFPDDAADTYDSSSHSLSKQNVAYEGRDVNELLAWPFDRREIIEEKSTGGIDGALALSDKKKNFSNMPIIGPVSASSAFVGIATLNGEGPSGVGPLAKQISEILGTIRLV